MAWATWSSPLPRCCLLLNWRLRLLAPSLSFHPKFYHHSGWLQKPTPGFSTPWHVNLQWPSSPCYFSHPISLLNPKFYTPNHEFKLSAGYYLLSSQLTINIFNLLGMSSPLTPAFSLNLSCLSFPFNVFEIPWFISDLFSGSCQEPKHSSFFLLYTDSKTLSLNELKYSFSPYLGKGSQA